MSAAAVGCPTDENQLPAIYLGYIKNIFVLTK